MKKFFAIIAIGILCACTAAPQQAASQVPSNSNVAKNQTEILFLVKFADDSKFGDSEILTVALFDGGFIDAPMQPIATFATTTDTNYGPRGHITGRLVYHNEAFARLSMPSFSARLEKDGRLIAVNTSNQPYSGQTLAETIIINRVN
ncbi:MAG: hypothetical protein FD163_1462 [Hyphomonadaceae bacterium]|nr:MAG: hypothetical protein FD128_1206 [Hyphomonadaceae bacterium]KAF0184765.1 MAG: hypothetical protein FD163_1462 [Hyphomonadaceae bacterium]